MYRFIKQHELIPINAEYKTNAGEWRKYYRYPTDNIEYNHIETPNWVRVKIACGPKQPIRDISKFSHCPELIENNRGYSIACVSCGICNQKECSNCGDLVDSDEIMEHEGDLYCEDCFHDQFSSCEECGEIVHNDDIRSANDSYYCESCFNENFIICHSCNETIRQDTSCYSEITGENYCYGCYCEMFTSCYCCGVELDRDYANYDENRGEDYCDHCYRGNSENIHDAGYKPSPEWKRGKNEPSKPEYYGFELEVENRGSEDNDDMAGSMPDFTYCKEDGSIYNGFEIVSHPLSFQWIKENKAAFDEIFNLRNVDFKSYNTSTCGMHVHISKRAFTTIHLFKFLRFFYDMDQDFILAISQRGSVEKMDSWSTLKKETKTTSLAKSKYQSGRYTAVNMQNSNTVEIRIFKGTLKKESFFKNLEFCKSVFEFTKDTGIKDITVDKFKAFLCRHKKSYRNLIKFIETKEL